MSQNDYKESVEEHRQSIDVDGNGAGGKPTRVSRKQAEAARKGSRPSKKNKNNSLLTVLAVIFVMIPVSILVFKFVISPSVDDASKAPKETPSENVQIETNKDPKEPSDSGQTKDPNASASKNDSSKEDQAKEKAAKEKAAKEKAAKEKAAKEKAAKEKAGKEKLAKDKADKEQAKKDKLAQEKAEKERLAKAKAEKEKLAKEKADKAKADKEKGKTEQVVKSNAYLQAIQGGYLHNAVAGDTIQSISIKYYGSEAYVGKIKQLNGISSDKVPPGTKVALIKP